MDSDLTKTEFRERAEAILTAHAQALSLPPVVYHYTSLAALIQIVKTGKVWCSNVKYSNDPAEIIYGDAALREMLQEHFPDFALGGVFQTIADIDYYTAAFSAEPDLLSQWRAYCQNGRGVAIGFDSKALASHATMLFRRVEYDRNTQIKLAADVMALYADPIKEGYGDEAAVRPLLAELALLFVVLRGIFKQRAYVGEAEYRLFNTLTHPRETHDTAVLFRATRTAVIPYYDVDLSQNRITCGGLPLREVIVGPCLDSELAEASIRVLLDQANLQEAPIVRSEVRMRAE